MVCKYCQSPNVIKFGTFQGVIGEAGGGYIRRTMAHQPRLYLTGKLHGYIDYEQSRGVFWGHNTCDRPNWYGVPEIPFRLLSQIAKSGLNLSLIA